MYLIGKYVIESKLSDILEQLAAHRLSKWTVVQKYLYNCLIKIADPVPNQVMNSMSKLPFCTP
jgi:hypothetical protein